MKAPGLNENELYRASFLDKKIGVGMQGTGLAENGKYIMWAGNGRYKYGVGGKYESINKPFKQIAIDPKYIAPRSKVVVEGYEDKGEMSADDTGGRIKGLHIDVFSGAIPISQAYALGTKKGRVGVLKSGALPGAQSTVQSSAPKAATPSPAKPATPGPSFDVNLAVAYNKRYGYSKTKWKHIQSVIGTKADGVPGQKTAEAAVAFQAANGLVADGVVGRRTCDKIASVKPFPSETASINGGKGSDIVKKASVSTPGSAEKKATVSHTLGRNTPGWCTSQGFSNSSSLDDLKGDFKEKAKTVINAVRSAGATVSVSSTLRHPGRAAMMAYARHFSDNQGKVTTAKSMLKGLGVEVSGNKAGASAANASFGVGTNPVGLTSNHISGQAVDISISGLNSQASLSLGNEKLSVEKGSGSADRLNKTLRKSRTFDNFRWYGTGDPPHWSINGR